MPNGWFCPSRYASRTSATPSPSASRNSVIRFGLRPTAAARFIVAKIAYSNGLFAGIASISASAVSTSPFGST